MSRFKFKIEQPGIVKLTVLDLVDMKLDELLAGYLEEGEHVLNWNPNVNLSVSVLKFRIELNEKIISENMFVSK